MVDEHSKALLESVYQLFDILHMNITGKSEGSISLQDPVMS